MSVRPERLLFAALSAALIPAGASAQSVSREESAAVLARVSGLYAPAAAARGARLRLRLRWENDAVDAKSKRDGNVYLIDVYGGLARHPAMTADALALLACHEIGHHFGGAPKMRTGRHRWGSTEGQADYFATLKCLRRVLADADPAAAGQADPFVRTECGKAFASARARGIRTRSAMAGLAAARLFHDEVGAVGARPLCWYRPPGRRPIVRLPIGIRRFRSPSHPALSSLQAGPSWDGR